jgi:hypothetical protein
VKIIVQEHKIAGVILDACPLLLIHPLDIGWFISNPRRRNWGNMSDIDQADIMGEAKGKCSRAWIKYSCQRAQLEGKS